MMFTKAERAEIGAELRKMRIEGKDRVHVISALSSREGWRVVREGARRASRAFRAKDDAVAYGRRLAGRLRKDLVIHTEDGGLEAWESWPGPAATRRRSTL